MSSLIEQRNFCVAEASKRQRMATDPSLSVWVEASAGTGKTKVLSDRVLRLLLNDTDPTKILCLTYTKAAAVEMNNRIAGRLSKWAVETDEKLAEELEKILGTTITTDKKSLSLMQKARKLFAVLLDTPGGIKIQTIHSFCQEVLKRFPLEAKISPYFEVMDDRASQEILSNIKNTILQSPPSSAVKEALALLTSTVSEYQFPDILKNITEQRNTIESYLKKYSSFDDFINSLATQLNIDPKETTKTLEQKFWQNIPLKEIKILIDALTVGTETTKKNALKLATALETKDIETYTSVLLTKDHTLQSKLLVKASTAAFPEAQMIAQTEADRLVSFINKKTAVTLLSHTKAVLILAREMLTLYQNYKKAQSKMDYNDLIILTKNLLETPKIADWILYKLDGGIDNILIDEAQDTSPEQWAIIKSLTSEFFTGLGRHEKQPTIFVVGDRKQSIYSFQGADPKEFEKMHNYFSNKALDFQTIKMDVSFRSTAAILDMVNQVFKNPEAYRGLTTDPESITHSPARIGDGGRVEFWPVIEPDSDSDDDDGTWKLPIEKISSQSPSSKLAEKIAETIKAKVSKGELLQSQGRPLQYKDFLILVQRRNSFIEEIVRACKNIGVAITGVDKINLNEQIAVNDLIAAAKFALLPDDDLNLACLLKSPLLNLTDDDLMTLCIDRKNSTVWQRLKENKNYTNIVDTLQKIKSLGQTARPFEFFSFILSALEGRKKFVSRLGPDCEDALDEFINLSLNFEQEHIPSLELFVAWIQKDDTEIKRDLEQDKSNAVRLMTVHGSKGLQAPFVILPDTVRIKTANQSAGLLKGKDTLLYPLSSDDYEETSKRIKEEENLLSLEEYHRLLYVALTRAEECLCICGYKGKKKINEESWYQLCRNSFSQIAEDLPDGRLTYTVPQELKPKEKDKKLANEISLAIPLWLTTPPKSESPLAKPLTPSHQDESTIAAISPLTQQDTTKLYQRGRLIHKLLQFLPDTPELKREEICETFLNTQASDFPLLERQKIKTEVLRLLSEPSISLLFSKNSIAEVSIMGQVEDRIISGQIDRLVIAPQKVMIIDYKTNRPAAKTLADIPSAYIKQMQAYKKVITSIYPDKEIETYILWTNTLQLMKL